MGYRLFADDSNLFHTFPVGHSDIDCRVVNENLQRIQEWCIANKLTINPCKTHFMFIRGRKRKIIVNGNFNIAGKEIKQVDVASFIGVKIDQHLTWKAQIRSVNECIRKKVGIIFRLRHFVPKHTLLLLYNAFIQPHITYGIEVWGSTYRTNLITIINTQKMAVSAITFSLWRAHSEHTANSLITSTQQDKRKKGTFDCLNLKLLRANFLYHMKVLLYGIICPTILNKRKQDPLSGNTFQTIYLNWNI